MPYSQNGWLGLSTRKLQSKYLTTFEVAGQSFRVRKGDVGTVLEYVATRFHNEVEPLTEGHPRDDWSFAYRSIRGSSTVSNHASGTAVDLNATQHPLGTDPDDNFTRRQLRAIRRIINDCDGVVRWGGDYSGRKDPMHFEINKGSRAVKRLARRIGDPGPEETREGFEAMAYRVYQVKDAAVPAGGRATLVVEHDGDLSYALGADMTFDITVELDTNDPGRLVVYQWDPDRGEVYHDYRPVPFGAGGLTHHRCGVVTHGRHLRLSVESVAAGQPVAVTGGRVDMLYGKL